jgi:hypothetical protein
MSIDISQHVEHLERLCSEAHRLLRDGGSLLITFPAIHHRFTETMSFIKRTALRRQKSPETTGWNPDHRNHARSISEWQATVSESGFRLVKSQATTLFPPRHRYGVPRFWFSNDLIHSVDRRLASLPGLQRFGQALMCVYTKS